MERLPPRPLQEIDVSALQARLKADFDELPNSIRTLAWRPPILQASVDLWHAVMGEGTVPRGLKWMVANLASKAAGCMYCSAHTVGGATRSGVEDAKTAALWEFESSPLFSDAERAALGFGLKAAQVPNGVTDEDFAQLRRHFSPEQCAELLAVVAIYGFFNRWNDSLATPLEPAATRHAGEQLGASGWRPGRHAR
jgi:alkylhydroperoxidase family enzyme